jgi:hypothetical protein
MGDARRSRRRCLGGALHRHAPPPTRPEQSNRPHGRLTTVPGIADRDDLDFTYSLIDRIFRLSLGELADFSGAKYDGEFSLLAFTSGASANSVCFERELMDHHRMVFEKRR